MNILVIDVGTSSIRGTVYDKEGKAVFCRQEHYQVHYSEDGRAEQDPSDWSDALVKIAQTTADFCRCGDLRIECLSLTSQRSSVIPVGVDGAPLRPAIMWQDRRNADIAQEFRPYEALVAELAGARISTVFSGSKMTWFRRNEPEKYAKTYKLCTIGDFLIHELTGGFRTDHTYGSRSLLMNIRTREWDDRLLELFEVERSKLCELVEPGSVVGTLTRDFASKTGLKEGTPMVTAGGDQQCAALGHGVTRARRLELTVGTGAFLLGCSDTVPEKLDGHIVCGAHAVAGKYVVESSMLACAAMYNWIKDILFPDTTTFCKINESIGQTPPGSHGCVVLPYFQGRGTPDWNSKAAGCFANLNLSTSRGDMARAVFESIAYEGRLNLEALERYMGPADQIYIGGGLTQSSELNQILADVCQKPLFCRRDSGEQTSLGAWISAAVTLGLYTDYDQALARACKAVRFDTYYPDAKNREVYDRGRQAMSQLYQKIYG